MHAQLGWAQDRRPTSKSWSLSSLSMLGSYAGSRWSALCTCRGTGRRFCSERVGGNGASTWNAGSACTCCTWSCPVVGANEKYTSSGPANRCDAIVVGRQGPPPLLGCAVFPTAAWASLFENESLPCPHCCGPCD